MMLLSLLIRKGRRFTGWEGLPPIAVSLGLLSGLIFLLLGKMALAVIFISYGIILLESRIPLRGLIRGFPGASILVTLVRATFFFLPLPFLGFPVLNPLSWGVLAGIVYGMLLQLRQLPDLRLMLSREFIAMLPPLSREERFDEMLFPTLGAVAQEYFYRGAMLYVLIGFAGLWSIIIAAALFTIEHLVHFNSSEAFDGYDILVQAMLGLGLGVIFYFSSSLVGCMLGHIVYNGFAVLQALRRKSSK